MKAAFGIRFGNQISRDFPTPHNISTRNILSLKNARNKFSVLSLPLFRVGNETFEGTFEIVTILV